MSAQTVFFYAYAAVAVAGAVGLVTAHRLVYAVMCLFATLLSVAALFLVIGSEFLAAMQLFVYGGAVTVLLLFVLMLTRQGAQQQADDEQSMRPALRWTAVATAAALLGVLIVTVWREPLSAGALHPHSTEALASTLFSVYVLPFEVAGLILTVALVGAIVLAREDDVLEAERTTPVVTAGGQPIGETSAGLAEGGETA